MEKAIDDKIFFRGGIGFGKFWEGDKIFDPNPRWWEEPHDW